jgi:integrase/recombinase XerD
MSQAKSLTQDEILKVLAHISQNSFALRNRAIFLTSLNSGMRAKEIACLKVSDVLNSDGTARSEIRLTADMTKGKHPRTVYVNEKLRTELQRYLDMRRVEDTNQPLFVTAGRKAFSAAGMVQFFYWLYKRCEINGATSHSGRRTYATVIASKGTSLRVLMKLMGHRNLATTCVYVDASDDMLRNAVELI